MKRRTLLLQGSTFLATVAFAGPEPILGGPCEGCELVYRDMPSKLASTARIGAAYPGRDIPEHVHMHVVERGKGTYWIDDLRFQDDPLINDRTRRNEGRGGDALVMPVKRGDTWHARRDVTLGLNVSPELT